jgi:hypothetical protein
MELLWADDRAREFFEDREDRQGCQSRVSSLSAVEVKTGKGKGVLSHSAGRNEIQEWPPSRCRKKNNAVLAHERVWLRVR